MTSPQRRALMKPFELLAISVACGVFVLLIIALTTRDWLFAAIGAGVTFVIVVVILAMLVLSFKPNPQVPVYLDRFQADSTEPGAAQAALKVDADAVVGGHAPREGDAAADADVPADAAPSAPRASEQGDDAPRA